jgi:hypothetical protein
VPIRGTWGGATTKSIAITRTDHTAAELRELAASSDDGAQVRRLLALALTLEGRSRTQAAEQCGMQRQTPRDWVGLPAS